MTGIVTVKWVVNAVEKECLGIEPPTGIHAIQKGYGEPIEVPAYVNLVWVTVHDTEDTEVFMVDELSHVGPLRTFYAWPGGVTST